MKRPIVRVPQNVLTTSAKIVTTFDKKLGKLIADMKDTLRATQSPKGVGLAAPQIGESVRVFVTRPRERDPMRVFVNPEVISQSHQTTDSAKERGGRLEGCLSIPNLWGQATRAHTVTLRYQDEQGATQKEEVSGFMAVIIQHETDHLNGILFTQRVLEQKGKFYQTARDAEGKEVFQEISLK